MNVIAKTNDNFNRKHSRIALFGSSYAACFFSIKDYLPFPIDFYCSRGTLIHSIELGMDNKFHFKPNDIGVKDPEWIKTIYSNSISTNQFTSQQITNLHNLHQIRSRLQTFYNTSNDRLNMNFSRN